MSFLGVSSRTYLLQLQIDELLAGSLGRRGVSSNTVEALEHLERASALRCRVFSSYEVSNRSFVLYCVRAISGEVGDVDARGAWFQAALLLDMVGPQPLAGQQPCVGARWHMEALLVRAVAASWVSASLRSNRAPHLHARVNVATAISARFGGHAICAQAAQREQLHFLPVANMSAHTGRWLNIFIKRFDVVTRGIFSYIFGDTLEAAARVAEKLVWAQPVTPACTCKDIAVGAFITALVSIGVLRPELLRPRNASARDWYDQFVAFQPQAQLRHATAHAHVHPDVLVAAVSFAVRENAAGMARHMLLASRIFRRISGAHVWLDVWQHVSAAAANAISVM